MTAPPKISVIIPVWNGAEFVVDALTCVESQAYPSMELLVVDDGSTDDTASRLTARLPLKARGAHHRCLSMPVNRGPAAARNAGLEASTGEFVAFLDIDDLWPAGTLERLSSELLDVPDLDMVIGRAQIVDLDSSETHEAPQLSTFPHHLCAAMYRRRVFERVGTFDVELRYGEDSDWFNRAMEANVSFRLLPRVTLIIRRHARNMTRDKNPVELNRLRVFKKLLDRQRARDVRPGGAGT
jgi:glycosyltransferase involved in cell wall biosynthesis